MTQNTNELDARSTIIHDSDEQRSTVRGLTKEEIALDLSTCPFIAFRTSIEQIRETMTANLGESTMSVADFERIRMPSGGSTVWTVQDIGGEKIVKELAGIILSWHMVRLFWKLAREQSDGATPPSCYARDAKWGLGDPGGDCSICRYGQFHSAPQGGGQACKLKRRLFLLREENLLPEVLDLPAGSLEAARLYFRRLAAKGQPCYGLITKLTLEKAKNSQGQEYSRAVLTAGDELPSEQLERAREYARMLKPLIDAAPPMPVANAPQIAEGEVVA